MQLLLWRRSMTIGEVAWCTCIFDDVWKAKDVPKKEPLKKSSPFQGFAKLRPGRLVRPWKIFNRLFRSCCCFLARKVSKGKIAFDAGNLAEVSPILEELSSALIPLAQHIADELMREDAGLNEKNHWLIFHANIRSRFDLSPYNSRENSCKMVSIREIFTHSGFPLLFRFPGPFFLLSTIENLSRMFFFCRLFLLQKWKRFGGDRKSGSRTLRTIH